MKDVVFVSRDSDEFKRYCKGQGLQLPGSSDAFSVAVGEDRVSVVRGFDEKDECARDHFSVSAMCVFLRELKNRMSQSAKGSLTDIYLFVHWGGGSWMDLEMQARTALRACSNNGDGVARTIRSAFAISSRRSKFFDVTADPICLPRTSSALAELIRRAEYGTLSEFWTRCAVFGEMPPCGDASNGFSDDLVKQFLHDRERATLESNLPEGTKRRQLKSIRSLSGTQAKVASSKSSVPLTPDGRRFLRENLSEEGGCV